MKRRLAILFIGVSAAMLFGCSATKTSGGGDIAEESSAGNGSGQETETAAAKEISFWHYMAEDKEGKEVNVIVDLYNQSQDRVVVKPQYIPRAELMKQYTIGVVSGDLPDCGAVDNPDHASFSSMGVFADITERFDDWQEGDFLEGPLDSCIYDGRIYGLPWNSNCLGLFYDADVLAAAGIEAPTNWSELEAACQTLTQGVTKGLAISSIGNEEGTFQYMPWLLSAGGDIYHLTSKESIYSMTFLKSLIDQGYISKESINWTQADVEKQFASGAAAMMINGPWNISVLIEDAPDKNWNVVMIPKADNGEYASVLGGENLAICHNADIESAWDFLTFMCNAENSAELCARLGRFSPRADVDVEAMYRDDPVKAVFASAMVNAQSRGPHPKWPEISAAIYQAEQEVFSGQKEVEQAMGDAQVKIDAIVQNR